MKSKPTFSVVVPAYNSSKFLIDCCHRICRQSIKPDKVYLVIDGVDPDTDRIIEKILDEFSLVEVLILPVNGGVNNALNVGWQKVTDDYVFFVAVDDWISEKFFEYSVNALETNESAGFVFSLPSSFTHTPEQKEEVLFGLPDEVSFFPPGKMVELFRNNRFHIAMTAIGLRNKEQYKKIGFDTNLGIFADTFLIWKICFTSGCVFVPEILTSTRFHMDSYSSFTGKNKELVYQYSIRLLDKLESVQEKRLKNFIIKSRCFSVEHWQVLLRLRMNKRYREYIPFDLIFYNIAKKLWRITVKKLIPKKLNLQIKLALLKVVA